MISASALSGRRAAVLACSLFGLLSAIQHAHASSAGAWEEFQQDVERACLDVVSGVMQVANVQVDPYGSESYGFAVITGRESGSPQERLLVCVYDKQSQIAEISSFFDR